MMDFNQNQPEETLREFLQRWCKGAPMPMRRQAEHLGLPESTLGNSVNPHVEAMEYKLSWLIPHMLLVGNLEPLDYLEACVGRVAFKVPEAPVALADLNSELALTIKEFGDVLMETGKALEDGRLQRHEVVKVEREVNEMVKQALGLVQLLKARMERY